MADSAALPNSSPSASSSMDLVVRAARAGAADASEAATKVWTWTEARASKIIYVTTYSISFGIVFPAALLARAIPCENAAVRGLIDGARAASQRVDAFRGRSLQSPAT
jgi:hypothetical protein